MLLKLPPRSPSKHDLTAFLLLVNFNAASKAKEINTIQKEISAKKKVRLLRDGHNV